MKIGFSSFINKIKQGSQDTKKQKDTATKAKKDGTEIASSLDGLDVIGRSKVHSKKADKAGQNTPDSKANTTAPKGVEEKPDKTISDAPENNTPKIQTEWGLKQEALQKEIEQTPVVKVEEEILGEKISFSTEDSYEKLLEMKINLKRKSRTAESKDVRKKFEDLISKISEIEDIKTYNINTEILSDPENVKIIDGFFEKTPQIYPGVIFALPCPSFEKGITGDFTPEDTFYFAGRKSVIEDVKENGFDIRTNHQSRSLGRGIHLGKDKSMAHDFAGEDYSWENGKFLQFRVADCKKLAIIRPSVFSNISKDVDMRLNIQKAFGKYGINPGYGNTSLIEDYMIKKLKDMGYSGTYSGGHINIFNPADLMLLQD